MIGAAGITPLGNGLHLNDQLGQPVLEQRPLLGLYCGKGQAHAEAGVGVGHLGFRFEDALVAKDAQADGRPFGEWIQRLDIAAAQAEFGGSRRDAGVRGRFDYFSGGDESTAANGALLGVRGFFGAMFERHLGLINPAEKLSGSVCAAAGQERNRALIYCAVGDNGCKVGRRCEAWP